MKIQAKKIPEFLFLAFATVIIASFFSFGSPVSAQLGCGGPYDTSCGDWIPPSCSRTVVEQTRNCYATDSCGNVVNSWTDTNSCLVCGGTVCPDGSVVDCNATCCASNSGSSCTSDPNNCGQINSGTYDCSGNCNAVRPPDSPDCGLPPPPTPTLGTIQGYKVKLPTNTAGTAPPDNETITLDPVQGTCGILQQYKSLTFPSQIQPQGMVSNAQCEQFCGERSAPFCMYSTNSNPWFTGGKNCRIGLDGQVQSTSDGNSWATAMSSCARNRGQTTANPYSFQNVSAGAHTVTTTVPLGWTVGYTLCYNRQDCHKPGDAGGYNLIFSSTASVDLTNRTYVSLWWHYTAPAPVTATITANPPSVPNNSASTISWTVTDATAPPVITSRNTSGLPDPKFNNRTVCSTNYQNCSSSDTTSNLKKDTTYTITAQGYKGPVQKSVNVTVGKPVIALSPTTFTFTAISGGPAPSPQTLTISNPGAGTLNWTASTDQGWCHVSLPNSASLPAGNSTTRDVSVDALTNVGTFICKITVSDPDATNTPQFATVTYTVNSGTLSVTLTPNPSTGSAPLISTLSAEVFGTAAGTINYSFWWNCNYTGTSVQTAISQCGDPDGASGNANGNKFDGINDNPKSSIPHTYAKGTYIAKVIAERDSAPPAEDHKTITANNDGPCVSLNGSCPGGGGPTTTLLGGGGPTTTLLGGGGPGSYGVFPGDYCSGVTATVVWQYSDPNGDPQSAYQVQLDNSGGSFGSPLFDSGKISSSNNSYTLGAGVLQFNTSYKVRVRVWDSNNSVSSWAVSDPWTTPKHAYPQVNFTWAPTTPNANQSVQFNDTSTYYSAPAKGKTWSWLFGDNGFSTSQNPKHTYTSTGNYNISLSTSDQDGFTCSNSHPIGVVKPVPIWKEIAPKE